MKSLVIFDLDGTLLNSIDDLAVATNYALHQCGFPEHSVSVYPMLVGNGVGRLLERALPEDARTKANIDEMKLRFMEYYDAHCCDATRPYPGIPELLYTLRKMDIAVAVASNKYQRAVDRIIHHYFPETRWGAVEGQKEYVPPKPDPSIVFQVLQKCPCPKQDVLYVGDSAVDIETARRACVDSVGVTYGFRSREELEAACAKHIVDRPVEILQLLRN